MKEPNHNTNKNNGGFFDLPPKERGATYDKAFEETGMNFFDLPPEERARYYDRATGESDRDEETH